MQKFVMTLAVLALLATTAIAQETCESSCEGKSECAGCPVTAAMEQLPKMTYKVGEESTCCSSSAAALAKEHDADIMFVVADKEYSDQGEAMSALADVTEEFVGSFTKVHTCSVSGTSLAGQKMHCEVSAGKLADSMAAAMEEVKLAYKVGEESCNCPTSAAKMAEEKGEKMLFVVGKEETCCSVDARIKVAHAKFRAAMEAFAQASAPSEEDAAAETVES